MIANQPKRAIMLTYKAPLRDIKFLINDVFDYQTHYKSLDNGENADPETKLSLFDIFFEGHCAPIICLSLGVF